MGPHRLYWKMIWKLKILPKIRVFAWRVGHEIMPTNMKIDAIRPNVNSMCQCYRAVKEMLIHAIKECPLARATLACGGNNFTFRGKEKDAKIIWGRTITLSNSFRINNLNNNPMFPLHPAVQNWNKPDQGFVKINVDAGIQGGRVGLGIIARDEKGFVLGGRGCLKEMMMNSAWAELRAIEE
ncbi:hypothetical protein PVK06_011376 [Gossypium arboreum]|uniref:Reverse transcriptase zinc-binding domain-containing protein n=1 Tax=Gossypium arboreum TaxID=29729 RepID=A0ABR0Q9F3_GOSAR|nr:hypothetical protein PVK06_011376 [Gossypium arboreum]